MAGHELDFTAVDDLVEALRAAGLRADVDPAQLNPPCVWVNVTGLGDHTLDGIQIRTRLVCIAPDQTHRRAMGVLAGLYNKVVSVVDPAGETTTQGTVLPDAPTPLPSLSVPFDLLA